MTQIKTSLCGVKLIELEKLLSFLPLFRSKQIYSWIIKGADDFCKMTNIPHIMQEELAQKFNIYSSEITDIREDNDAKKIVISLKDGSKIESVLLKDGKERYTACLSTQAGCPAGCVFCKTGSLGFKRNLDNTEITEQFFHLQNLLKKTFDKDAQMQKSHKELKIDNIVIMGMGEPFLNMDNLRKAVAFFNDSAGMNFSRRRITVSTCGICESLFDVANNGPFFRLALSLTTADELLRNKLMPVTKTNPLYKIKEALLLFQKKSGERITLEVPLLGGVNTREIDASSIADFSKGLDTIINIIPWNPAANLEFEGKPLREPDKKEIHEFIKMLESRRLNVTKRLHKGRSVMGACGQLGVI
ncbi:MAG: 23S rRNA (adenine(2503)-C(2))-methyltransferase RlmN [Treponema sp.]|nr:23S rRNA (adenine(2503)-C(2))-methyltransferase RlmN [Treponema sp.]